MYLTSSVGTAKRNSYPDELVGNGYDITCVQVAASSLNGEVDTATHLINSLHLIHTTLTVFEFVDDQLEMLQVDY